MHLLLERGEKDQLSLDSSVLERAKDGSVARVTAVLLLLSSHSEDVGCSRSLLSLGEGIVSDIGYHRSIGCG